MPRSKLYNARKFKGLCTDCGNGKLYRGTVLCEKHWNIRQDYDKNYRNRSLESVRESHRRWYHKNRGIVVAWRKGYVQRIKQEVINHYGGMCRCCGETELVFLALDHINGDGARDRKANGLGGYRLYTSLRKKGYPDTFQVLCANCNWAKFVLGACPHERRIFASARSA